MRRERASRIVLIARHGSCRNCIEGVGPTDASRLLILELDNRITTRPSDGQGEPSWNIWHSFWRPLWLVCAHFPAAVRRAKSAIAPASSRRA